MSATSQELDEMRTRVAAVLAKTQLPELQELNHADQVPLQDCFELEASSNKPLLKVTLGFACQTELASIETHIRQAMMAEGIDVDVAVDWMVLAGETSEQRAGVPGVKQIVAIASGKGGVGKSTTSVNIALALAYEGAKVGILDADIYGPSQPQMLGVADKRPDNIDGKTFVPIEAHGIKVISMGNLVDENTAMAWRGPMVSGALQQLLRNTNWQELDYLVIDMPPGTGDIQLTLSQTVPVSGSLIVTTPQDIALLDAKKGIDMFRKVNIPVVGVVENMAIHICSKCGHGEAIFGSDGGTHLAQEYGVDLLGQLPLQLDIRQQTDEGKPPVAVDPESPVSKIYRQIARRMGANLWLQSLTGPVVPEISVDDD
ncbi:iron-sulfur cluster carrier protein ApbC [Teredinibacter sp. KSP-S5-2]|uniref:iron-sulfur cluster carrier protein ApbC n=1 Tax=Teredinibacter sp. KSP-S5-2 TaxID=3034506 RepID=UPI002934B804|nr:iron-sulfur cluster carrier protein ApbC [Teredinibacter sp. KSP-S5-2]WNO10253.1 iron-sulfur cluster carrier protein ApbC [Teredinibacter sp. KSP-S5-2]